jgi:hypothetical protein
MIIWGGTMKRGLLAVLAIVVPFLVTAITIDVESPEIINNRFASNVPLLKEAGQPAMPYIPLQIALPMGHQFVALSQLQRGASRSMQVERIAPASAQQPMNNSFTVTTVVDEALYRTDSLFPAQEYRVLGTQYQNGYALLMINWYPYRYNPVQSTVQWNESISFELETRFDQATYDRQNAFLLSGDAGLRKLSSSVIERQNLATYRKTATASSRSLVSPNEPYQMIIITSAQTESYLDDFITWKIAHGITPKVYLTGDIYAEYTGEDNAAKVRTFITDAYTTWSGTATPLEYVILAGDDEIVPLRGCYGQVGNTIDNGIPTDIYFSNLDGDWNADGDNIYGEVSDDPDYLPEVAIGRFPAETEAEFANILMKHAYYTDNNTYSNDIVYFYGENLNNNPLTWGGDYKDEIEPFIPAGFHINKLYDREGTFSTNNVKNSINQGLGIINHMGHCNETYLFGQNNGHVASYTNTEYGFAYSQGCYPAAFDEATSQEAEAVGENIVISEHGLYAFVGNTRYGWYAPGSTNGASQPYDIKFFEALFNENMRELGDALVYSRLELVNEAMSSDVMRWVHYELILFGDPSIAVKDPVGTFPYVKAINAVFDDVQGDGDGIPNPGERLEIFVELENEAGWEDATNVTATISFPDDDILLITGSVDYGTIPAGTTATADPFVVELPQDVNYASYPYTITVTAPVGTTATFEKSYVMDFEISLYQKHWPWHNSFSLISNPIITDLNQDGTKDIVMVDGGANVNVLDINAQSIGAFPVSAGENILRSTALADIDGDGFDDIVIANREGEVHVVDHSGASILTYNDCCEQLLTPVVANIAGDAGFEIISMGSDRNLIAINSNGDLLSGFPVEFPILINSEMAAGDIDADGLDEILVGTLGGDLFAYNGDGSAVNGFPVSVGAPITGAPIIINENQIVLGTMNNKVFILDANGAVVLEKTLSGKLINSAIAADFDNDQALEIAFATQNGDFYIIEQNGAELAGWPISTGEPVSNPPIAADIDNDDVVDFICLTSQNDLYAYHADGQEIAFAPVPVGQSGNVPVTLEDIDGDGDFEVVSGISNGAFVIDIKLPKGDKIPWNTYRGNYRRTGNYQHNTLVTSADPTLPPVVPAQLYQNFPNPFNPETTIRFSLPADGAVNLEVFNIRGQKVKTLLNKTVEAGVHEITWKGTDDSNKSVSSGIYFYKMNTPTNTDVKKMILLK